MADNIKGITLKILGDTSDLSKSFRTASDAIYNTQTALRAVDKALKLDPGNVELIAEKQKLLANAVEETEEKLKSMKQAAETAMQSIGKEGGASEADLAKLKAAIVQTENELNGYKEAAADASQNTKSLGNSAEDAGSKADKAAAAWDTFGKVAKAAAAAAGAAIAAAGAATVNLVTNAVEGYASVEQLSGGIEKLYGDAATVVTANANDAFKNAGMSAEEYMQTATSISATMINALGGDTAAAAEQVDVAIRAMSDNASVFGTDLSTIQSAFVGFSRGQYQMLDSLSLGYAGTQEGMIQLINDSGILNEEIDSLENVDFSQMVSAIQAVQENMGIAGNTAEEAGKTISGSVDAAKSAWQNWVNGLADENADVGQLTTNLVDAGMTALDNIAPAVQQALTGIKEALPVVSQVLTENLPTIINDLLPPLITTLGELLTALSDALPDLLMIITDNLPALLEIGADIIGKLAMGLLEALPTLVPTIIDVLMGIVDFANENIDTILEIAFAVIESLVSGITANLPQLIPAIVQLINSITQFALSHISEIVSMAVELILGIVVGFISAIPEIVASLPQIIDAIVTELKDLGGDIVDVALTWGSDLIDNFVSGISNAAGRLWDSITGLAQGIKDTLGFSVPRRGPLHEWKYNNPGADFVDLWAGGVDSNLGTLQASMNGFANVVTGGASTDYTGQLNAINANLGNMSGTKFVAPIYIGGRLLETYITEAETNNNFRSGGR